MCIGDEISRTEGEKERVTAQRCETISASSLLDLYATYLYRTNPFAHMTSTSLLPKQETANVMYSLALMTFDAPYGVHADDDTVESKSLAALWAIHRLMLNNFSEIDPADYNKENYDQYGMYFEMMRVIPGGNELVMEAVGRVPRTTGQCNSQSDDILIALF